MHWRWVGKVIMLSGLDLSSTLASSGILFPQSAIILFAIVYGLSRFLFTYRQVIRHA
jgi:hypothetical protein